MLNVCVFDSVGSESSSSWKFVGERPPPALKEKSCGSFGTASLTTITLPRFVLLKEQVTVWGTPPLARVSMSNFCVPVAAVFYPAREVQVLAAVALTAMAASYLPTLRFYARSPLWVVLLPVIGALYLAMTWGSALRFYRSERANWKGRVYA